jgi:hypothetical protein
MLLTAFYSVAALVFEPQFRRERQALVDRSQIAETYRSRGMEAFEQGAYGRSVRNLERYLRVQPADAEARQILENARTEQASQSAPQAESTEPFQPQQRAENFTTAELLERARRLLDEQDYFTAHYYATLAREQRPGSEDAQRLVTQARQGIEQVDLSERQEEERRRYQQKRAGYNALFNEDNPIEAYSIFLDLQEEYPGRDPDVERYMEEAIREIRNISFFLDEVESIAAPPAANDILVVDPGPDGGKQFVHVQSLYRLPSGSYAERVEVVGVSPEWEVDYHFLAPYTKFVDSHLALRGIERDNPENQVTPTYYVDNRTEELRYILRLDVTPLTLEQAGTDIEHADILTLWRMTELFPRIGFPDEPVYVELGLRLTVPFSFLVLSLLTMAVTWRWRSRYIARPPLPALLLIPLLPLVLNYFTLLFLYGQRVVATFLLIALGVSSGFIALLVLQGVLVVFSLAALAIQVRE